MQTTAALYFSRYAGPLRNSPVAV